MSVKKSEMRRIKADIDRQGFAEVGEATVWAREDLASSLRREIGEAAYGLGDGEETAELENLYDMLSQMGEETDDDTGWGLSSPAGERIPYYVRSDDGTGTEYLIGYESLEDALCDM